MNAASLPDFRAGIEVRDIPNGAIVSGRVDSEEAILIRRGDAYFAVGAQCTHYHGALALGLVVDDTVRCPLHHACFSLRTGAALRAPALDPIACSLSARDCAVTYKRGGRILAVASISRDLRSLEAERNLETT